MGLELDPSGKKN